MSEAPEERPGRAEEGDSNRARRGRVLLVGVALALSAVYGALGLTRFIDGDEGFYLLAAKQILHGQRPYADFFFPQMPLVPYLYASWLGAFGETWSAGRVLAGLLGAAIGTLVAAQVFITTGRAWRGGLAALLFAASGWGLAWFSVAKTYSTATLLLVAASTCLVTGAARHPAWARFCSGLLLGLAVDARLYFIVGLPVLAWWQPPGTSRRERWLGWGSQLGGLALGVAPALLLWGGAPGPFVFDNWTYHGLRSEHGLVGDWSQKASVLAGLALPGRPDWAGGVQVLVLLALLAASRPQGSPAVSRSPSLRLAAALGLASLLPTPTYPQYFAVCVPFLVAALAERVALDTSSPQLRGAPLGRVTTLLIAGYVVLGPWEAWRLTVTGAGVPGVNADGTPGAWRLGSAAAVAKEVDRLNPTRRPVYACWPGHLLEAQSSALVGTENPFSFPVADQIDAGARRRYRVPSRAEVLSVIRSQGTPVVLGNCRFEPAPLAQALAASGFTTSVLVDGVQIWLRSSPGAGLER